MSAVSVDVEQPGDNRGNGEGFHYARVSDFAEILSCPSFLQPGKAQYRVVVCDFDGVLSVLGNDVTKGVKRMQALHDVARQANRLVISSSRITMPEG